MTNPHEPQQKGNSEVFQDGRSASESAGEVKKADCEGTETKSDEKQEG